MDIKSYRFILFALAFMFAPYALAQHPGIPDRETGFMGEGTISPEGHITLEPLPERGKKRRIYGEERGNGNRQTVNERFTKAPSQKQKKK